jgi:hypothetical protein
LAACGGNCEGASVIKVTSVEEKLSPSADKLQLFQMGRGIDKIARRSANCGNKRLFGLTYH